MLSFFPRGVLDEILNLIESVSEDFPSYSQTAERIKASFLYIVFVAYIECQTIVYTAAIMDIEDLRRVVILYEIYETSLRRVS